jgi:4'-phosphopantetheinyl transferase
VGVDVEAIDRFGSPRAIAEHFLSPEEVAALSALPPLEQEDRFFDYWTLKKAYIKARGMGLRLPLDQFSMLIAPTRKVGITFAADFSDDAGRWCFLLASPSSLAGTDWPWPTVAAFPGAFRSSLKHGH